MPDDKARARRILQFFKLTISEWNQISQYQEHSCAICGRKAPPGRHLNTDHRHDSGKISGLLCTICNRLLGRIESQWPDTIRLLLRCLDYLKDPPAPKALGREVFTFPGRLGTKRHRKAMRRELELKKG